MQKDYDGNEIVLGDKVALYWQTKQFGRMLTGIVINKTKDGLMYTIQTNFGTRKKSIFEIVKVG